MTPRERVLRALAHDDVLPWQIDLTGAFAENLCRRMGGEDAESYLGNHLLRAKYKANEKLPNGQERDLFGVVWAPDPGGGDVGIITGFPMKDATSFGDYCIPEVRVDFASGLCDRLEQRAGDRFTMFSLTMCFFERAWSLRGMENILMDMVADESFAHEMFDRIEAHHMELLDAVLDRDFDGVYFGDDWGQQKGLIMGAPMWRKYIKPAFTRMFDKIKRKGKFVCLHSCGDNREIFGDLVDMGMDIYNTLQPEIYDLEEMKRQYGKDVTFYGGISTQQFLPFATPDEVKQKVKEVTDVLGKNGGYILAPTHSVTADIPVENVMAMIESVHSV
jgi:uroporphyrinogen decarboxylase